MQRGLLFTAAAASLAAIGGVVAADLFDTFDSVIVTQ